MDLWKLAGAFFKVVTNLPVLIGAIHALMLTAETTDEDGQKKKEAVVNAIIMNFKNDFNIDLKPYEKVIGWLVDAMVSVFNMLGFFVHKKKAA